MEFGQLSPHLEALMDSFERTAAGLSAQQWQHRAAPEKWSRAEIAGHLVDSACNNHQRFVRALCEPSLEWPGYDQEAHVRVQKFASEDPRLILGLMLAFNRHIAWMFAQFPAGKLQTPCTIGGASTMTLENLALDYVAHLEHHIRQVLHGIPAAKDEAVPFSGMPWPPADPTRAWPA
jgi:hypothetical protein